MANQYVPLAKIKDYLFSDQGSLLPTDDAVIKRIQDAVADYLDAYIGRGLLSATYTETRNGRGGQALPLFNYPITSVTSLTINGQTIVAAPDDLNYGYVYDNCFVYLRTPFWGSIASAGGFFPVPIFETQPRDFTRGVQNVTVVYVAGYTTLPADLTQAIIELVAYHFKKKDHVGVTSDSTGGIETTSYSVDAIPTHVKRVFDQYRRITI